MALSDCPDCWETPCVCGNDYKRWPTRKVVDVANGLVQELYRRGYEYDSQLQRWVQVSVDGLSTIVDNSLKQGE